MQATSLPFPDSSLLMCQSLSLPMTSLPFALPCETSSLHAVQLCRPADLGLGSPPESLRWLCLWFHLLISESVPTQHAQLWAVCAPVAGLPSPLLLHASGSCFSVPLMWVGGAFCFSCSPLFSACRSPNSPSWVSSQRQLLAASCGTGTCLSHVFLGF